MRTRHKIPSIFNLSMVDVLCCALGCVILLWLLNLRNANEETLRAGQTDLRLKDSAEKLSLTEKDLADLRAERDRLQGQLHAAEKDLGDLWAMSQTLHDQVDTLSGQLADTNKRLRSAEALAASTNTRLTATEKDRDGVTKDRDALRVRAEDMAKLLEALRDKLKDADARIASQTQTVTSLDGKLAAALARVASLEKDVKDRDKDIKDRDALATANMQRADSLAARLADAEDKLKKAQALAAKVPGLEASVKELTERFAKEEALANKLEIEIKGKVKEVLQLEGGLKEAQADVASMRGDRVKLTAAEERIAALLRDLEKLKAAGEARFAGVTLGGKRVVFLVDMSGSMDRVDQNTVAPNKWKEVRETLARVMRSIPDLEKFQVILFNEKVQYLLGRDEKWIDYDPKASADQVLQALSKVTPVDGTNMYAGLEAAFRFRPQGLDTVYLLSDGLPNDGPGLTQEQTRTLSSMQKGEVLGKYIRGVLKGDWNKERPSQPRVKINCLGFFYESPDLGAFLWALARENDGNFVGMSQP